MPNIDSQNGKQSQLELNKGMTGYFLRKNSVTDNICQPMASKTTHESLLKA